MAAEFGLSIISSIAKFLVEPTRRQLGYMFCFKSFVQELGEQKEKLALAQDHVQNVVKDAKENDEEIEKHMEKWMEDAQKVMTDVTLLESKIRDDKKCFAGWCPNLFQHYKLSKEMQEKTTMLKKLENVKFQRVGRKAHVSNIDFLPSKDFIPLNSSKEAFKVIMEALKDDKVNMIGLCGMGGVGKTTLVKEAGRKAKELQLFDQVLMVVVSQTPDIMRIQDRLAENLVLSTLKEATTEKGRAERLLHRLQREQKVLIILDDVWRCLSTEHLKNMGIAFGDDQKNKGWKILLTTRLHEVCTSMDCQKKIFLQLLPENDAWDLFKTKANLRDEDSALNSVAHKVAEECKGLPIAIVVVGTALRGKRTVKEWEVAIRQLKTLLKGRKHSEKEENVYACLNLSYDYLNKDSKFCLLLCSLFSEDHEIPIEDLTRYAIGYGLCNDARSMEDARDQVFVAIKELKDSCLLLDASKRDHVKMHDLVREVAIEVASQGEHVFLVKAGIRLKEWPTDIKSFENFTAISLMGNDITRLPNGLVCPKLKILMLGRAAEFGYPRNSMLIPEKFFEGMEALQVLSLKCASLSLQALERLVDLQFLELINCECKDITTLGKLHGLQILSFRWSDIKELPNEMGELKKLRLLDLTECHQLRTISRKLIPRFENLEELYLRDSTWDGAWRDAQRQNAIIADLNSLSKLTAISLSIPGVESILEEFAIPHLSRYVIDIGREEYYISSRSKLPPSRGLNFWSYDFAYFRAKPFKQLFLNVRVLLLFQINGYKNMVLEIAEGSFENLVDFKVFLCPDMEWLIDTTQQQHMSTTAFLNLERMDINGAVSLRELCKGRPPMGFLHKLQTIRLKHCFDIYAVFPANLWQALQNLEAVYIYDSDLLTEIFELDEAFYEGNEVLLLSRLTTLTLSTIRNMTSIWKGPTRYVNLQNLIDLSLYTCPHLTFIFTLPLAQSLLCLETLIITNCSELEQHIIREKEVDDRKEQTIPKPLCFPKLTTLKITDCPKLEYVFPVSVASGLLHLEELLIDRARQLKRIFGSNEEGEALAIDGDRIFEFPRLRKLKLLTGRFGSQLCSFGPQSYAVKLPSLQCLETMGYKGLSNGWAQPQGFTSLNDLKICYSDENVHELRDIWNCLTLENLTSLEVTGCHELEYVFPRSIIPSLVQLKSLEIYSCNKLEEIIGRDNEDEKDAIVLGSNLPSLCEIAVSNCDKLKSLFPVTIAGGFLPQLKSLKISRCRELKEIIARDNAYEKDALEKLKVQQTSQLMEGFGQVDKAAGINVDKQIVVPNLVKLSLKYLPELVYFCPPNYHVIIPRKATLELDDCPKMDTTFTSRPDGGFIAKSMAIQEAQRGSE